MHGCCTGPFEVPGHSCSELSGQLAHSDPLQGVSESSQRYRSPPHSFFWPPNERQEECALPISANRVFGGSLGFHSDAGPFGSCQDIQFYSMSGPLQARPSCLGRYLPQAARPHGSGLSCVAPRVASHEAVPLVEERAQVKSSWALLSFHYMCGHIVGRDVVPHRTTVLHKYKYTTRSKTV